MILFPRFKLLRSVSDGQWFFKNLRERWKSGPDVILLPINSMSIHRLLHHGIMDNVIMSQYVSYIDESVVMAKIDKGEIILDSEIE